MWLTIIVLLAVPADAPKEADQPLRRVEEKLAKAKSLHLEFEAVLEASDGKSGKIKGTLDSQEGGKARLEMTGEVADKKLTMLMVSDGKKMSTTGLGPASEPKDTPKKLDEIFRAIVARSGVLLPLFVAESVRDGEKPKEPDIDEMFKVSDVKLGKKEKVAGREAQAVEYKLTMKGTKAPLAATVWLDPKTDLPLKRVLKGMQDGETMTITETYTDLTLDKKIEAKMFELPK
jgi:outer membrane lipoprotein-sorting protein